MNGEGFELLWAIHGEEWLSYQDAEYEAVLARHGMGLFELWAVDQDAAMLALKSGLPFFEWLEATNEPPRTKRL